MTVAVTGSGDFADREGVAFVSGGSGGEGLEWGSLCPAVVGYLHVVLRVDPGRRALP